MLGIAKFAAVVAYRIRYDGAKLLFFFGSNHAVEIWCKVLLLLLKRGDFCHPKKMSFRTLRIAMSAFYSCYAFALLSVLQFMFLILLISVFFNKKIFMRYNFFFKKE